MAFDYGHLESVAVRDRQFWDTSPVINSAERQLRIPSAVLKSAAKVGALVGIPTAALTLPAFDIVMALAGGANFTGALQATGYTYEDLEMVPFLVIGAVVLGAVVALAAAGAWLLVTSRRPGRPWLARGSAALAAALVPLVLLVLPDWPFAVAVALPAAILAAIGAPMIGRERRPAANTSNLAASA